MRDRETTQTKPINPSSVGKSDPKPPSKKGDAAPLGFLTILAGNNVGQAFPIHKGKTIIGRGSSCDIQLADTQISREHLEIEITDAAMKMRDLKTTNGTFVKGKAIKEARLHHGDEVTVGLTTMHFALVNKALDLPGLEKVADHETFLHRVDDEIDRARRAERTVTVVMLHLEDPQAKIGKVAEEILSGTKVPLRKMDLLAIYGQRDLELLLPEMQRSDAKKFIGNMLKELKPLTPIKAGLATYPSDASSRDLLIEKSRMPLWVDQSNSSAISDRKNISQSNLLDDKIILHSPKMRELYQTAIRIAPTPIAVLIQGETGTGKELVAESIHNHSGNQHKPFMAVNCGAFTQSLLESELFGHERGAFTGAEQRKIGLLEAVKGGTLFLDEIGEIPPPLQVKLLRVLQDSTIRRVGGTESIKVDFRVVSATNKNLRKMVEQGTFREDLYYRLNAIILEVPPLRERLEEIPHLATFFLEQYKAAYRKPDLTLANATLDALSQYPWPGNVRELKNCLERAVVITPGSVIFTENLNLPAARQATPRPQFKLHTTETFTGEMRTMLDDYEKQLILNALQKTGWNQTKASVMLKIPRRTLVSKIKKYNIIKP